MWAIFDNCTKSLGRSYNTDENIRKKFIYSNICLRITVKLFLTGLSMKKFEIVSCWQ